MVQIPVIDHTGVMVMMEMADTGVATEIMADMMLQVGIVEVAAGMMGITMMVYLLHILLSQGLAVVQAVMAMVVQAVMVTGMVEDMVVVVEDPEFLQVAQVGVLLAEEEILLAHQAHHQAHRYLQITVLMIK